MRYSSIVFLITFLFLVPLSCDEDSPVEQPPCTDIPGPSLQSPEDGAAPYIDMVTLEWEPSEGILEYQLLLGSTADLSSSIVIDTVIAGTSIPIPSTTLQAGSLYFWKIRAVHEGNFCPEWSPTFSFSPRPEISEVIVLVQGIEREYYGSNIGRPPFSLPLYDYIAFSNPTKSGSELQYQATADVHLGSIYPGYHGTDTLSLTVTFSNSCSHVEIMRLVVFSDTYEDMAGMEGEHIRYKRDLILECSNLPLIDDSTYMIEGSYVKTRINEYTDKITGQARWWEDSDYRFISKNAFLQDYATSSTTRISLNF